MSVASVVVVHAHLRYIYLVRGSASSNPPGVIARNVQRIYRAQFWVWTKSTSVGKTSAPPKPAAYERAGSAQLYGQTVPFAVRTTNGTSLQYRSDW